MKNDEVFDGQIPHATLYYVMTLVSLIDLLSIILMSYA